MGAGWRYAQRLERWAVILRQLRGCTWRDQMKLLASAAAAPVLTLRDLSSWQDPVLLFDACIRAPRIGRFHVRRHTDDLWHVLPSREQGIHDALERLLRPGAVFVDAGANVGFFTLLASRLVGPTGRVLAIEMMPATADILRQHVATNDCTNVELVEKALSDRAGDTIMAKVPAGKHGQATVADFAHAYDSFEEHEVQTTTLDEVCGGRDRIALLKLDLEGAELHALAGARSTLERTDRVIYESHTSSDDLARAFEQAGFKVVARLGKDRLAQRADLSG
jgi:FkbM family methyltransferase